MKNSGLLILVMLSVLLSSCKDKEYELVHLAKPEYMSKKAFRASVVIAAPRDIVASGKIYVYDNYVLVNDTNKGIHIIDNSTPETPVKKVFIEIIGNNDMEVRGDYLYADSLMDLLVFDISDLNNIKEVTRLEDVLHSYVAFPSEPNLIVDSEGYNYDPDQVLVNWTVTEEYREVEDDYGDMLPVDLELSGDSAGGQGGSLARFKIVDDYLYAVDDSSINVFDISNLEAPSDLDDVYVNFGIETIFNRGHYLFLGSTSGLYIYDITSADAPKYVSEFSHATACDPVVVDEDYAYVTLRGGNLCGALESRLEIIDISNITTPALIKTYAMDNPYGLGIKDDLLFICDGTSGLKVYNKENVGDLKLLKTYADVTAYDVIPLENRMLMIGGNTLYQYHYTDESLELFSEFALN